MASDTDDETRFRVLVPVWGERYIKDFCAISLPALLSSGNLPELVRSYECEIIFLTTKASQEVFENTESIQRIKQVCPYSFIFIDDLLPLESYGIILTVAYGRGIASLGARQTSTYFLFLNADFVLSNGILRTVIDRVGRGYNAVMAPSLRCMQEEVVDILHKRVSSTTGTLDASSPELVRLTLKSLHLTASASIVNQQFSHHIAANQFFWRVDDQTLIGHFFLLFMLCIRPEKPFESCVGWCDYTFVPELVPSGNYDVIVDSDDGFILEMQARRGESHSIRAGRVTPEAFAPRLSFWTTANHRDYAARTIVFRAGALPANFESVKAEANAFMAALFGRMKRRPTSHLRHPWWTGYLANLPRRVMPPELSGFRTSRFAAARKMFGRRSPALEAIKTILQRKLVGAPPHVRCLHYAYLDYKNFAVQIASLRSQCPRTLYVRERPSPIDTNLENGVPVTTVELVDLTNRRVDGTPFDGAIITLIEQPLSQFVRTLGLVAAHCADGAPVLVCIDAIEKAFFWGRRSLHGELIELMGTDFAASVTIDDYRMVSAPGRHVPAYLLIKARDLLASGSISAQIAYAIIAVPAYGQILLANLGRIRESAINPWICTSATMTLRGSWQSMAEVSVERASCFGAIG